MRTFVQTSDDFFRAPGNFDRFGGQSVDLAFIDGMHLAEFVTRDFMNTDYVLFMDHDDYLYPGALRTAYACAVTQRADVPSGKETRASI